MEIQIRTLDSAADRTRQATFSRAHVRFHIYIENILEFISHGELLAFTAFSHFELVFLFFLRAAARFWIRLYK